MAPNDLTCQYCPKTLGNAGAKAQHERACEQNPANQPGGGQERRLAPREGDPLPDTEGGAGDVFDSIVRVVDDDLPASERARGARGLLGFVAEGIDWYQSYRERKLDEQEMRAQRVELGDPEDLPYPECECGYQFTEEDIGLTDTKVRCPECTRLYPIVEKSPDEIAA